MIKEMGWFVRVITLGWARAITLAPFGIYIRKEYLNEGGLATMYEEKIHWRQQVEMGIIFFYLWYLIEWGIRLFKYGKRAYNNISFEREAKANRHNLDYLRTMKPYAWVKYLKNTY